MKLFSLIVANYNNSKFLDDLIKSVLNQSYTNWELIITDDASSDNFEEIVTKYHKDARIKFIRHPKNSGVAAACKTGVDNSSGEIIGKLDADDALLPDALEKIVNAHEKYPDASMINTDCFWCDEQLNILHKYEHTRALEPGEQLIRNIVVGNFATFKREAYLKTVGFDPTFKKAVDHDIYLKLDEAGTLEYVHEALYLYRKNPIGISQNANGVRALQFSLLARYNAYKRRLNTSKENLTKKEIKEIRTTWYSREVYFQRIDGNRKNCNRIIKLAIKEVPSIIFNKVFIVNSLRNIFYK